MKITRFEDLDCWQVARKLPRSIYRQTADGKFSRDYGLRDQMRRASMSIMANIAEGFARKGSKEFGQFLFVAKASAAELQSHAYVALDQGYMGEPDFKELYDKLDHVSRMFSNLIKHLSTSRTQQTQQTQ